MRRLHPLPLALPFLLPVLLAVAGCSLSGHEAAGEDPDFPGEATAWRALRYADENGNIPVGAFQRALGQRTALVAATAALDDGGIAPSGWVERGPFNVAGRSRTIAIDPRDTRILWSGGVSGGLWKSVDRGATWQPVDDWWTNLAIGCLVIAPGNPDVMYVGTGEGFFNLNVARGVNRSAIRGAGVFKSTDGGATWTHLSATASWEYVQRVAVSPTDPNLLLAAVRPGGIYRSTDGGSSWTQVHAAFASEQVEFDPADPTKAVGHRVDASLLVHDALWSQDGGATWSVAQSGLVGLSSYDARMEFCYARSNPGVVYASCGFNGGKVWRSADGGRNWVLRTGSSQTGVTWYFNGFWVDPTNENVMVAAGLHVWRSTNGGVSFSQITNGYIMTVDPHLDVHFVAADPDYDGGARRRVYVATDGGLHVADDILAAGQGTGWRDIDAGQRTTQFYGASGVGSRLAGGLQDNGTLRLITPSTQATMTFGGDGGQTQIDPTNPSYVYGEYVWCQVHRSTNGGSSSSYIYGNINERSATTSNFIAPLVLDPNLPTRLYAGASSLWRTNNCRAGSVSWSAIKPPVGSFVSCVAVAQGNADVVWVGHNDGRVYRTANATAASPTWIAVDDNAGTDPLPNRYVTRIAIDPTDHRTVWATFGGFASGNVRKSVDGGATWADASGTGARRLPDAPVNCVLLHPDATEVVYVATEVGIFASDDAGQNWSADNDGPANVSVEEVAWIAGVAPRTLLAATLGRGLWTCEVVRPGATVFGTACQGHANPPVLGVDPLAPARIGTTMQWTGTQILGGRSALLLLGLSDASWAGGPLPQDLTFAGMPGCPLLVRPDTSWSSQASTGGEVSFPLALPNDAGLLGLPLFGQLASEDPSRNVAGLAVSRGLRVVIGR
ncbi:MAG: hypothetical protein IPM29_20315 [Planctomycetes bacterium]|nr:hypothetical protein [Planctomycetota bacterium]